MLVRGGGLGGSGNVYNVNFDSGVATVSCYDGASGKCGSKLYPAGGLQGIDYDAAIPLAYWPSGWGVNGNCDQCGIKCSNSPGNDSYVHYNDAPLCYQITSRNTSQTKIIRINDSCGEASKGRWPITRTDSHVSILTLALHCAPDHRRQLP